MSFNYEDLLYRPGPLAPVQVPVQTELPVQAPTFQPASRSSSSVVKSASERRIEDLQNQIRSLEQAILSSRRPLDFSEGDIVTVNGERGLWLNKHETDNFHSDVPISAYPINDDAQPDVIRKKTDQNLVYEQEVAIRYLRPPTPAQHGQIILKELQNILPPVAPPLVIRQQPPRPETPPPLVLREAPPAPPQPIPPKIVTIPGKKLPPPPRKVVIERLPQLPQKPQAVIIERWLPYKEPTREVRFVPNTVPDPVAPKQKNVIIQWESPEVFVKKEYRDLGVIKADPQDYISKYRDVVKNPVELPSFVQEIQAPTGIVLAAQHRPSTLPTLVGDVDKLRLIDLDREGLGDYKDFLSRYLYEPPRPAPRPISPAPRPVSPAPQKKGSLDLAFLNLFLANAFAALDREAGFKISKADAAKAFANLNDSLNISTNDAELNAFVNSFDHNLDGFIDFNEFKRGIVRRFVDYASELQN